jgi:linoleoyl-CoA desaturase
MNKVTFESQQNSFFRAIKEKVDHYFSEQKLDPAGNLRLYIKSSLQILSAVALYVILVFFTPVTWVALILCVLLGLNLATIGFNIMHEGGHQSFSKHAWLNSASAYFLNVLGGNSYFWKIKHNINHHTYTNIEGVDSDIDVRPFMRLHNDQPRYKLHKFQHLYWVVLYGISYVVWVFYEDFLKYFTKKVAEHMEPRNLSTREHFVFWFTKACFVGFYIVLPIVMVGWLKALVGFSVIAFVCGLFISIVFQLAHVVGITEFPLPDQSRKIKSEWAVHQVQTTANFATKSKLLFWLLGGLNFQIEHHLFPRVSHIHYPQISRFVRETCAEYNIAYHEYSSMFQALVSHLLYLRKLGTA